MPTLPQTFRPSSRRARSDVRRGYDGNRREAAPWRDWYNHKEWRHLRAVQLASEPLCERCLAEDRVTAATTVHHRTAHRGDWSLFADPGNLASVCKACHDGEIQRGERAGWTQRGWAIEGQIIPPRIVQPLGLSPSAVPLTIVCGPPGAGKSVYVAQRQRPGDIVVDMDDILAELSGTDTRSQDRLQRFMVDALMERNRRLAGLATEARAVAAWFVVGAAQPSARELWAGQLQPRDVVVVETPASVCTQRIMSDPMRSPTVARMIDGVYTWWMYYDRSEIDTIHLGNA